MEICHLSQTQKIGMVGNPDGFYYSGGNRLLEENNWAIRPNKQTEEMSDE